RKHHKPEEIVVRRVGAIEGVKVMPSGPT
ncbi:MAG: hypothetical protein QOJ32_3465, partial [Frankiaceae bacterium]|nr:hypothetical protein [Frankiaceae bacterium]